MLGLKLLQVSKRGLWSRFIPGKQIIRPILSGVASLMYNDYFSLYDDIELPLQKCISDYLIVSH